MYTPGSFRNENIGDMHDIVEHYNFGTLVTHGDGDIAVTHLPFLIERERGDNGTLVAHMARANPHWKMFTGGESVVMFMGPHCYVSPAWYRNPVTVPTWNYAAIHAWGTPRLVEDDARLREMVFDLIERHEAPIGRPWPVENAEAVIATELRGIVGFEIPITRLDGKFKFNQNHTLEDQERVVSVLERSHDSTERAVAAIIRKNIEGSD